MDNFKEEQKEVNVLTNQEIIIVESSLNKELDGFQIEIDKKKNLTSCRDPYQSSPINLFIKRRRIQKKSA